MNSKKLNHNLKDANGNCAACQFLLTAIRMMAEEYKPDYRKMLALAQEEHARQLVLAGMEK